MQLDYSWNEVTNLYYLWLQYFTKLDNGYLPNTFKFGIIAKTWNDSKMDNILTITVIYNFLKQHFFVEYHLNVFFRSYS